MAVPAIKHAVLLAAGEGARLRPLTTNTPKCLLPVGGRPLLGRWLAMCAAAGVERVFVNGFYLAEQVEAFVRESADRYAFDLLFVREEALTGTGGFVRSLRPRLTEGGAFFMAHADNFTNLDIGHFAAFHAAGAAPLSLALFRTRTPGSCGIVEEMDPDGRILRFREKPADPRSNLASAAMFMVDPSVLALLPESGPVDFSAIVLPALQGMMRGWEFPGFNLDIGTPDAYRAANEQAERMRP